MPTELTIGLSVLLVFLIFLSSFFSAAETAYSSVNPAKIQESIAKKKKTGRLLSKHIKSFGWTLSTILIGNNLVNIGASVLISYIFGQHFSNQILVTVLSIAVMTPIIVIFGEIFPKLFARKYAFGYLVKIVFLMELLNWFFLPLTLPLKMINLTSGVTNTEDQIKQLLNIGKQEGVIEKREATLATNALEFDSIKTDQVYTKMEDVVFVNSTNTAKEIESVFKETGHTRLPVKHQDKMIGVINFKDLIFKEETKVLDLVQEVPTISRHALLTVALEKLRYEQSHIAFVSNSNKSKGVIGIITMEDIIEELIGEIYDEYDKSDPIREVGLHKWVVLGSVQMNELEKKFGIAFNGSNPEMTFYKWVSLRINRHIKQGLKYIYDNKIVIKVLENKKTSETIFEVIEK